VVTFLNLQNRTQLWKGLKAYGTFCFLHLVMPVQDPGSIRVLELSILGENDGCLMKFFQRLLIDNNLCDRTSVMVWILNVPHRPCIKDVVTVCGAIGRW
jgi:hypothetical protein